jgi:hypothetical protein
MEWKRVVGVGAAAFAVGALVVSPRLVNAGHTNVVLTAELNGQSEVSDRLGLAGDPNGRGEAYVFGIDGDGTTLCYVVLVERVQLVTVPAMMAHIHEGPEGVNGPVVANLAGPEDGNAADCLTEGEPGKFPTGEAGIVQRILNNPEGFYINVHNPEYRGGAIRGQLATVEHQR